MKSPQALVVVVAAMGQEPLAQGEVTWSWRVSTLALEQAWMVVCREGLGKSVGPRPAAQAQQFPDRLALEQRLRRGLPVSRLCAHALRLSGWLSVLQWSVTEPSQSQLRVPCSREL